MQQQADHYAVLGVARDAAPAAIKAAYHAAVLQHHPDKAAAAETQLAAEAFQSVQQAWEVRGGHGRVL